MKLIGQFTWGSNFTFLTEVSHENHSLLAVYKPSRGERPLWDFPEHTLARREVGAYLCSQALGWGLVPLTVYRRLPLGTGSLQLFIPHDPDYQYFRFTSADVQKLLPMVLFDLLINNADRKGSHILKDANGHLWGIDHGVSFHTEPKLRSVIWDFAGELIPQNLIDDLVRFIHRLELPDDLSDILKPYLRKDERTALRNRAEKLVEEKTFLSPDDRRRWYPYPPI
ncbi:MAG TPA: SCO1664 family protein [Longilinea sp.]|nr:SCO1664 family protein [Longilinea sp.]